MKTKFNLEKEFDIEIKADIEDEPPPDNAQVDLLEVTLSVGEKKFNITKAVNDDSELKEELENEAWHDYQWSK